MYLEEEAIDRSVRAVRALSAKGSVLALTYFDRRRLDHPDAGAKIVQRLLATRGEPYKFGWVPSELPTWLAARGFELESDLDMHELATSMLPPRWARRVRKREDSHMAVARAR